MLKPLETSNSWLYVRVSEPSSSLVEQTHGSSRSGHVTRFMESAQADHTGDVKELKGPQWQQAEEPGPFHIVQHS